MIEEYKTVTTQDINDIKKAYYEAMDNVCPHLHPFKKHFIVSCLHTDLGLGIHIPEVQFIKDHFPWYDRETNTSDKGFKKND